MPDTDDVAGIRWAFRESNVRMTRHALLEALTERIPSLDIQNAGSQAELLEDYVDRVEGHTQLLLGYARPHEPLHLVVNVDAHERDPAEPVVVVTVYRPEPPSWIDERTRGARR